MKALGIMGIVLLHSIFIENGGDNNLSIILRLVGVKTLLLLSGYVIYGKLTKEHWLIEKIIRRLPILIIYPIIYWFYYSNVAGIDGGAKLDVNLFTWLNYNMATGFMGLVLWYIWLLILCYLCLWVFERYQTKIKLPYLWKLFLFSFAIIWIPYDYFGVGFLRWYGIFLFLGYGIRYVVENYKKIAVLGNNLAYSCLLLFPIAIYIEREVINYSGLWVSGGYINILNSLKTGEIQYVFVYLFATLSGIGFFYVIAKSIVRIKYISAILIFIGNATIGILLIHKPLLVLSPFHNIYLDSLLALLVSMGLYLLLKKVRIFHYLLFGGTSIPITLSKRLGGWYGKAQS
jgi:hypothetical protein